MKDIDDQIKQEAYFLKYKFKLLSDINKKYNLLYLEILGMIENESNFNNSKLNKLFLYIDTEYKKIEEESQKLSEEELLLISALFIKSESKLIDKKLSKDIIKIDFKKDIVLGYNLNEMIVSNSNRSKYNLKKIIKSNVLANNELKNYKKDIKSSVDKISFGLMTILNTYSKYNRESVRNEVDNNGWISLAVLDSKTSSICIKLNKEIYPKKKYSSRGDIPNLPPRHFNCRSVVVRTTEKNLEEVKNGVSFTDYIKRNKVDGEKLLGKQRYKLFMESRYDIKEFISDNGQYFTLKELESILT